MEDKLGSMVEKAINLSSILEITEYLGNLADLWQKIYYAQKNFSWIEYEIC